MFEIILWKACIYIIILMSAISLAYGIIKFKIMMTYDQKPVKEMEEISAAIGFGLANLIFLFLK